MKKYLPYILAGVWALFGVLWTSYARGQTYVTASVASYHLDRSKQRNEQNYGLGFEHEVFKDTRLAAGYFRNSNYLDSTYVGVAWSPLHLGDFKLGGFVGGFTGYALDIKWGVLPVLSYERSDWGANLTFAPESGGTGTAVFGLQLKYRIK